MSTEITITLVAVFVAAIITLLFESLRKHLKDNNAKRAFASGLGVVLAGFLVLIVLTNFMDENIDNSDRSLKGIVAEKKLTTEYQPQVESIFASDNNISNGIAHATMQDVDKSKLFETNLPAGGLNQMIAGVDTVALATNIENQSKVIYPQQIVDEAQIKENDNQLSGIETVSIDSTSLFEEISIFLNNWSMAWENTAGPQGDIEAFSACYGGDFSQGDTSRSAWLSDKKNINSRKNWIKVEFSDLKIESQQNGKTISASFLQDYSSSNYSQKSPKTCLLEKENDKWKIIAVKQ